jgi:putative hydrolase of the HAD superfamily
VRAVTLDLWRTLIDESPAAGTGSRRLEARIERLGRALAHAGLSFDRATLEAAMSRSRESFDRDHNRGVDITYEGRVRQLLDFVEPGLSGRLRPDDFASALDAVDAPFLVYPPVAVAGAGKVIEKLAGMGVALALISNTGFTSAGVYRRWLAQLGWLRWLKVTSFSNEVAVAKPTPAIFERTLAALEVPPGMALHVGDSPLHDVAGARRAGMAAAWLNRGADACEVRPDYEISDIGELPEVVERWLATTPD